MAESGWLYPNSGYALASQVTFSSGTGGTAWQLIDDDPTTGQPGSDYVEAGVTNGTCYFATSFTDMPADFDSMDSVDFEIYYSAQGWSDDTSTIVPVLKANNNSTNYWQQVSTVRSASAVNENKLVAGSFVLSTEGLNATKADWDSAVLRFDFTIDRNMGADGGTLRVHAIRIKAIYTASGTSATATPGVVDRVGSVNAPASITASGLIVPGVVGRTGSVLAPTIEVAISATVVATEVDGVGSVPLGTITLGAGVSDVLVDRSSEVPTPTIETVANATVITVTTTGAVETPAPSISSLAGVAVVESTGEIPAGFSLSASALAVALEVERASAILTPTIDTEQSESIVSTVVDSASNIPVPGIACSKTITSSTVESSGSALLPTLTVSATDLATVVDSTAEVPAPALSLSKTAEPIVVTGAGSILVPTPTTGITVATALVDRSAEIPAPSVSTEASTVAIEITGTGSTPVPSLSRSETAEPSVVGGVSEVGAAPPPGQTLLQAMDLWVDGASDYPDSAVSRFTARSGQEITIGSGDTLPDSSNPVIAAASAYFVNAPGSGGDFLKAPATPMDTLTDYEIILEGQNHKDGGSSGALVSRKLGAGAGLLIRQSSSGSQLQIIVEDSIGSTGSRIFNSVENNVINDGQEFKWRIRVVQDNGSGFGEIRLAYWDHSANDWSADTVFTHSTTFATGPGDNAELWLLADTHASRNWGGRLYKFQMRDDATGSGALIYDVDAANGDAVSFTDGAGVAWTLEGDCVWSDPADGFFYFPGSVDDHLSIPDPGHGTDFEYETRVKPTTTTGASALAGQWGNSENSWFLTIDGTTGQLNTRFSTSGVASQAQNSGPTTIHTTGGWVKVTRLASTGETKFWTKLKEEDAYTQAGSTSVWDVGKTLFNSTQPVLVGGYDGIIGYTAIYKARLRHAIDSGGYVVDIDGSSAGHKTFVDGVGNTITVNRTTTAGNPATAWVPPNTGWSIHDDVDDYLTLDDSPSFRRTANGEFTMLAWYVGGALTTGDAAIAGSVDTDNTGEWWFQELGTERIQVLSYSDPGDTIASITPATSDRVLSGDFCVIAVTMATDGTMELWQSLNGADFVSVGTTAAIAGEDYFSSNNGAIQIGGYNVTGDPADFQIGGLAANYSTKLAESQINDIVSYLNDIYNLGVASAPGGITILASGDAVATTVESVSSIEAPTLSGSADASPATTEGTSTLPAPTPVASEGSTVVATIVDSASSVEVATLSASADVTSVVVGSVGQVFAPSVDGSAQVIPTVVESAATIPVVTPVAEVLAIATTVESTGEALDPTPDSSSGATVVSVTVGGTGQALSAAPSAGSELTPSTVGSTGEATTPTITHSAAASVAIVTGSSGIPSATLVSSADVVAVVIERDSEILPGTPASPGIVIPTVVTGTGVIAGPTLSATGSVVATVVDRASSVFAGVLAATGTNSTATVDGVGVALPATVAASGLVASTVVDKAAETPQPAIQAGSGSTAAVTVVTGAGTILAPTALAESFAPSSVVDSVATILVPTPDSLADSVVIPLVVVGTGAVLGPVVSIDQSATALVVEGTGEIPSPSLDSALGVDPVTVSGSGEIPGPTMVALSFGVAAVVESTSSISPVFAEASVETVASWVTGTSQVFTPNLSTSVVAVATVVDKVFVTGTALANDGSIPPGRFTEGVLPIRELAGLTSDYQLSGLLPPRSIQALTKER